ncbi:MAG: hypothetical protein LBB40_03620 [Holophagales bacterium]|jgi:flagellar hook protein FlgE|nr:hypothetical protein [Holophagales bacterium]
MDTRSVGLSGMSAAAQGVQAVTNNVANIRSEDLQARRADQPELSNADGGQRPTQTQAPREQAVRQEASNAQLDRDREAVNQVRDEEAYTANAAVIRTNSQAMMTGTVVDLKA